jgi:hypothetical protein
VTLVNAETGEIVVQLADLETVIERGLGTFVEVGDALAAIRDGRLYRSTHSTFEDYCQERWGFSRPRAYEMIHASEIVSSLSAIADTPAPRTESQARALAPLKANPEQMAAAMTAATEATAGRPTAAAITQAVKDLTAEHQAKVQDAAEFREFIDEHTPAGFDAKADAELTRQRGEIRRLCRDMAGLPDPEELIEAQGDYMPRLIEACAIADDAFVWLDSFLKLMEDYR